MVKRATVALFALMMLSAVPRLAHAEDWIFFDPHPIHPAAGGGFCEVAGAHVHDYAPVDPGAFVMRDGLWFFVGDPVAYGYRGTVYRFDGGHDIDGSEGLAACTRAGVHYHLYPPPTGILGVDAGTVYVTPIVAPYWFDRWDRGSRRRVDRSSQRPHAFPVDPPVEAPRRPSVSPAASRPRAATTPRRPSVPTPPPPARPARPRSL